MMLYLEAHCRNSREVFLLADITWGSLSAFAENTKEVNFSINVILFASNQETRQFVHTNTGTSSY